MFTRLERVYATYLEYMLTQNIGTIISELEQIYHQHECLCSGNCQETGRRRSEAQRVDARQEERERAFDGAKGEYGGMISGDCQRGVTLMTLTILNLDIDSDSS